MNSLEAIKLVKLFGKIRAVDEVSFSVPDNKIFGLIGRNGAGKTTIIRMIMNILAPDSGEVFYKGEKTGEKFRSLVGYLPEERGLYRKMKVMDTINFFAEVKGKSQNEVKSRAEYYLKKFDLYDRRLSKVDELSKGNQQKVQFICTIIHNPDFIILDEPFSGLDPVNTELLKEIILELKSEGKIIILSTHLMDFAEKLCDDIVLINHGKVVLSGSLQSLKSRFAGDVAQLETNDDVQFLVESQFVDRVGRNGNQYSIRLKNREYSHDLLSELVKREIQIQRFAVNDISLHDIFIRVAGNENAKSDGGVK
ncbi:MAG: ABC transporter ATP-binding protein [Ignavibacteriales bacterium]